ncbi:MAG: hypothetical protein AAGN82_14730 [Myxococcota bacterium]
MMRSVWMGMLVVALGGCPGEARETDPDGGSNTDTDTDVDSDVDSDSDTDTDTIDPARQLRRYELNVSDDPWVHDVGGNGLGQVEAYDGAVFFTRGRELGTASEFFRADEESSTKFGPVPAPTMGGDGFSSAFERLGDTLYLGVTKSGQGPLTSAYQLDGTFIDQVETSGLDPLPAGERTTAIYSLAPGWILGGVTGLSYFEERNESWEIPWSISSEDFTNGTATIIDIDPGRERVYRTGADPSNTGARVGGAHFDGGILLDSWEMTVTIDDALAVDLYHGDATDGSVDAAGVARYSLQDVIANGKPDRSCAWTRFTEDGEEVETFVLGDLVDDIELPTTCFDLVVTTTERRIVIGWMGSDDVDGGTNQDRWVPFVMGIDPGGDLSWFERLTESETAFFGPPLTGLRLTISDDGDLYAVVGHADQPVRIYRFASGLY